MSDRNAAQDPLDEIKTRARELGVKLLTLGIDLAGEEGYNSDPTKSSEEQARELLKAGIQRVARELRAQGLI